MLQDFEPIELDRVAISTPKLLLTVRMVPTCLFVSINNPQGDVRSHRDFDLKAHFGCMVKLPPVSIGALPIKLDNRFGLPGAKFTLNPKSEKIDCVISTDFATPLQLSSTCCKMGMTASSTKDTSSTGPSVPSIIWGKVPNAILAYTCYKMIFFDSDLNRLQGNRHHQVRNRVS